jgi:hypothetical protein
MAVFAEPHKYTRAHTHIVVDSVSYTNHVCMFFLVCAHIHVCLYFMNAYIKAYVHECMHMTCNIYDPVKR